MTQIIIHRKMVEKGKEGENGVIISLYVESTKLRTDRIKKINPFRLSSRPRVFRTQGYDRHAQLLTYAQGLRRTDAKQLKRSFKNPRWKSKKRRWTIVERIRRLFSRFHRTKRQWKYESIAREDCSDKGRWSYGRRGKSNFCKKLRCFLKKIYGAWKCNKGGY